MLAVVTVGLVIMSYEAISTPQRPTPYLESVTLE